MARLRQGEKSVRSSVILQLLRRHRLGLREVEIADELRLERRTVNNYLRELDEQQKAHRHGRLWFPD